MKDTRLTLNHRVGDDIRALRKGRGVTIKALSQALGRSIGWLSQVERGQTTPSINDLSGVASYFGVNISFFFRAANQRPEEQGIILRATDRVPLGSSATGLIEELLSPSLGGAFEMIKSTFAPRSDSGGMRQARQTEEGGVLISGRLSMTIGALTVDLAPGDSFQFAERNYSWANGHDEPAVVIWIVSPPVY